MLVTTFIIFSCFFIFYIYRKLTFWSRQKIPNEISSIWNRFLAPFHLADQKSTAKYGPIVGIYEGLRPTLMITDLELVNKVLVTEFKNFVNHRIFYHEDQVAGKNLVVLEDNKWRRMRSILSPSFSILKLKKLQSNFDTCIDNLVSNFEQVTKTGEIVDVKDYFGSFSIDVICSVVFSIKIDSINDPNHPLVKNIRSFFGHDISFSKLIIFFFPSLMKILDLYLLDYNVLVFLNNFTSKIISERKQAMKDEAPIPKDFIQLLLEANEKSSLSDQEIFDQVILFLVAGYDTSAAALSSIVYCLALNEDVQEKLFEEVYNYHFRKRIDLLSQDDLNNLKYLDAVINETLRYLPLVPRIERRSNKNCKLGNLSIPKDTMIIIPIYTLNHDPKYFKDPENFDPDRFLNESAKNMKHFLPFASGPRNCIGMTYAMIELKSCLARIILQFKFLTCPETKIPLEYYTGQPVSTAKEIKLCVRRRGSGYWSK